MSIPGVIVGVFDGGHLGWFLGPGGLPVFEDRFVSVAGGAGGVFDLHLADIACFPPEDPDIVHFFFTGGGEGCGDAGGCAGIGP